MNTSKTLTAALIAGLLFGGAVTTAVAQTAEAPAAAPTVKSLVYTAGANLGAGFKVFNISGGTGQPVFALFDESGKAPAKLPEGLTFSDAGLISGVVPAGPATRTVYTTRVTDQGGGVATRQFSLQINPALNVATDPIRLTAGGQINVPIQPFKISGGTGSVAIGFVNRAGEKANAPSGLTLNKDGGLSGRVPDNSKALEDLAVKVVDQGGGTVLKELAWVINPALAIKVTNAVVTAGGEIPAGLTPVAVTGGTGSARYALFESDGSTAAALPASLSFNQINGQLTGQANVAQASEKNYVVKVTDQGGGAAEGRFKLTVNKPLQLSID